MAHVADDTLMCSSPKAVAMEVPQRYCSGSKQMAAAKSPNNSHRVIGGFPVFGSVGVDLQLVVAPAGQRLQNEGATVAAPNGRPMRQMSRLEVQSPSRAAWCNATPSNSAARREFRAGCSACPDPAARQKIGIKCRNLQQMKPGQTGMPPRLPVVVGGECSSRSRTRFGWQKLIRKVTRVLNACSRFPSTALAMPLLSPELTRRRHASLQFLAQSFGLAAFLQNLQAHPQPVLQRATGLPDCPARAPPALLPHSWRRRYSAL